MVEAVIADNWLAANPQADQATTGTTRDVMKRGFFSRQRGWLDSVARIGMEVVGRALSGLR